jgi:hypothetical protein
MTTLARNQPPPPGDWKVTARGAPLCQVCEKPLTVKWLKDPQLGPAAWSARRTSSVPTSCSTSSDFCKQNQPLFPSKPTDRKTHHMFTSIFKTLLTKVKAIPLDLYKVGEDFDPDAALAFSREQAPPSYLAVMVTLQDRIADGVLLASAMATAKEPASSPMPPASSTPCKSYGTIWKPSAPRRVSCRSSRSGIKSRPATLYLVRYRRHYRAVTSHELHKKHHFLTVHVLLNDTITRTSAPGVLSAVTKNAV